MAETSNLAKALGVDDGQEFEVHDYMGRFAIMDVNGTPMVVRPGNIKPIEGRFIFDAIAHPEWVKAIPTPRWTPAEVEQAKALLVLGFWYLAKDGNGATCAYEDYPLINGRRWEPQCPSNYAQLPLDILLSVKPGECVALADIAGGADDE